MARMSVVEALASIPISSCAKSSLKAKVRRLNSVSLYVFSSSHILIEARKSLSRALSIILKVYLGLLSCRWGGDAVCFDDQCGLIDTLKLGICSHCSNPVFTHPILRDPITQSKNPTDDTSLVRFTNLRAGVLCPNIYDVTATNTSVL